MLGLAQKRWSGCSNKFLRSHEVSGAIFCSGSERPPFLPWHRSLDAAVDSVQLALDNFLGRCPRPRSILYAFSRYCVSWFSKLLPCCAYIYVVRHLFGHTSFLVYLQYIAHFLILHKSCTYFHSIGYLTLRSAYSEHIFPM